MAAFSLRLAPPFVILLSEFSWLSKSTEIESQIEAFARRTGESKDDLVRKALLSYLEDRQDALRAEERLKHIGSRISLAEIGRKYGLAD
jgi:hypothetical protein